MSLKQNIKKLYYLCYRTLFPPSLPVNPDGKVYVNLGCGVNTGKEFVNVDTAIYPNIHYVADIRKLNMFTNESVDFLYASHVVEHIPRGQLKEVLREWRRVLKTGGIFRMGVPDLDRLIEVYRLSNNNVSAVVNQIMGAEGGYDDHHSLWNLSYAKELLEEVGFTNIHTWDPQTASHHNFHDKTTRVIDVGGKKIPISLNIEATKQ